MPESEEPVEMVLVRFYCNERSDSDSPVCGQEMKPTGYSTASIPPHYQHVCPAGHRLMLDKYYPYLDPRPRQGAQDDFDSRSETRV